MLKRREFLKNACVFAGACAVSAEAMNGDFVVHPILCLKKV